MDRQAPGLIVTHSAGRREISVAELRAHGACSAARGWSAGPVHLVDPIDVFALAAVPVGADLVDVIATRGRRVLVPTRALLGTSARLIVDPRGAVGLHVPGWSDGRRRIVALALGTFTDLVGAIVPWSVPSTAHDRDRRAEPQ